MANALNLTPAIPANQPFERPSRAILSPGPRFMRRLTGDALAMLDWVPELRPLFTVRNDVVEGEDLPVRAGNFYGVFRPGFDDAPFGVVTDVYKPLEHQATAKVVETCGAPVRLRGAYIDGHGYHVVHSFELTHLRAAEVRSLPVRCGLVLVHDHTGAGTVRASIVTYVGQAVVGSVSFVRKMHVGCGAKNVGSDGLTGWTNTIGALCEAAVVQQDALIELLSRAATTTLTTAAAEIFASHGVKVTGRRDDVLDCWFNETTDGGKTTLLDVAIAHHEAQKKSKKHNGITWGVFSRRLEGDALRAIAKILGVDGKTLQFGEPC